MNAEQKLTGPSLSSQQHGKEEMDEALLPSYILDDWLRKCPRAGSGVHKWLIRTAVRLHRFYSDRDAIASLLSKYSAGCGRDVSETEVWSAVTASQNWLKEQASSDTGKAHDAPTPKAPTVNVSLIESIVEKGPSLEKLAACSPVSWNDGTPHTEEILSAIFPPHSLVCVGASKKRFATGPLSVSARWKLLRGAQFIVPSPMSARRGLTKDGRQSAHTLSNTGPRRFLVIEFDERPIEEHSALLWHLGERERLVLAVHSGGKSIHGWFFVDGKPEESLRKFMDYAISIGADPATWTKSQFVRMPDGMRDNGNRQKVVYYDPTKLEAK